MSSTASQDIRTLSGWYYLAAVMDLYSRKIVGFKMGSSASAHLVCQALQIAIAVRQPPAGLIIHSDQDCQYTSKIYQKLVADHQLKGSMSKKVNCWSNAVMESSINRGCLAVKRVGVQNAHRVCMHFGKKR